MKPRGIDNIKSSNTLGVGLHHVVIKKIGYLRNSANQIINDKDGSPKALSITFTCTKTSNSWKENFYLSKAAFWRLESLCKAIKVDLIGDNAVDVAEIEMIKKLQILIYVEQYQDTEGKVVLNGLTSKPLQHILLDNKFYAEDAKLFPDGDPTIPSGSYLRFKTWEDSIYARRST